MDIFGPGYFIILFPTYNKVLCLKRKLEADYVRQNTNLNILNMRKTTGYHSYCDRKVGFLLFVLFFLKCQLKKRQIGQEKDTRIQIETFLP